jgi:hypothetical protein
MKKINMKQKINFYAAIPLISAVFMIFAACLNPVEFNPDDVYNITGDINTTDVTSAVLMLTNRSKTVDVTNVTITQPEWEASEKNLWAQAPSISITNRPKRLERKAQYLTPSDKSYQIVIDYTFDAIENSPTAGTGTKTLIIPLPLPRQVVELFIYRNSNGDVIIDIEVTDPDLTDTGNPPETDPSLGEGSSPAVIPPENRNKMATFVVINKTNSQIIDSSNFKMGGVGYTMGKIGVTDKQSIALGQGAWDTTVKYTLNNTSITLGPKSSVIVPSNDPQAIKEHYLYFYKTKRGDYNISQEWPPYPNDADEEDLLPPDIYGKGRGLIKIINNSYSMARLVTIVNLHDTGISPMIIYYPDFSPPVPVQYAKTGYVNVIGTADFPIDAHEGYLIQVSLEANDSLFTVERKAYIKDQVVTILINGEDLKETNVVGAKVTLQNKVSSWPVMITSMIVRNKASAQSSVYGIYTWQPSGVIGNNNEAVQYVISSAGMPILKGEKFEAVITVQGNHRTGIITRDFSPAELYSELPPGQNTRTLTITNSDIPDNLKETFVPVTSIILHKNVMDVDLGKSAGRLDLNNNTVNPSNATVQGPITWAIVNPGDAECSLTNGLIEVTGRTTSLSSTTIIKVKATIQNAAGTLFNKTDYTQTFDITVNFSDSSSRPDVWADNISFTGSDLTIKVGEYRNLISMIKINPSNATVTKEDIDWSIVGSDAYFNLNGPNITGKAVGIGKVKVVLPASKNNNNELQAILNVTVKSDIEDKPVIDDGRILTPEETGDSENWVEIARNGDYSLIVRAHYINIYPSGHKNDPAWNYIYYGANNAYGSSNVRGKINLWFHDPKGIIAGAADKLPSGARLRQFTVQNTAIDIPGTSNSMVGLNDGFSKPIATYIPSGNDVAFALSYGEAANFCSRTYFIRNPNSSNQTSSAIAQKNYGKISIPSENLYGMWLRSPGDLSYTAGILSSIPDSGRVFQYHLDPNSREYGLVYPALWVHQDIFKK